MKFRKPPEIPETSIKDILRQPEIDDLKVQLLPMLHPCWHCGGIHFGECRRIKRLIVKAGENITEVEYWPNWEPDEDVIMWRDVDD